MYSSKHLDRTRSETGSEQIRRVNSILVNCEVLNVSLRGDVDDKS